MARARRSFKLRLSPAGLDVLIDSHCHLNFPELRERIPDIRSAMRAAQVHAALLISTKMEEFAEVHALAQAHDNFWCTVGVHPDTEGLTG